MGNRDEFEGTDMSAALVADAVVASETSEPNAALAGSPSGEVRTRASRRDFAALFGLLGGAVGASMLTGCATPGADGAGFGGGGDAGVGGGGDAGNDLGSNGAALTGTTGYKWATWIGISRNTGAVAANNLRNLVGTEGQFAFAAGFYASGDGGGGMFVWDPTNGVDDLGLRVNPYIDTARQGRVSMTNPGTAQPGWVRVWDRKTLHAKWFGVKADRVTDDTPALVAALAATPVNHGELVLCPGQAKITQTLTMPQGTTLRGNSYSFTGGDPGSSATTLQSTLVWAGANVSPMLRPDIACVVEGVFFDVISGFKAYCGVAIDAVQAFNTSVELRDCQFFSRGGSDTSTDMDYGVTIGTLSPTNIGNLENCRFVRCHFSNQRVASVLIGDGEPYNTSFVHCSFFNNRGGLTMRQPYGSQPAGYTWQAGASYGVGVQWGIGFNAPQIPGSLSFRDCSFSYLAVGIRLVTDIASVSVENSDSEGVKRLIETVNTWANGQGTINISGGRYSTGSVEVASAPTVGSGVGSLAAIPANAYDYIVATWGMALTLSGAFFGGYNVEQPLRIRVNSTTAFTCEGCSFPTQTIFYRQPMGGVDERSGGTYIRGCKGLLASAPAGIAAQRIPERHGCENPRGVAPPIAGTATTVAVVLPVAEMAVGTPEYVVQLEIESTSGTPTLSPAYVTAKTATGFTINVAAAPGAGNSVTYAYTLRLP